MPDPQTSVRRGVIVFIRHDDGERWLMLRRAASLERAPLKVGFPGGEIEPGESETDAAIREAQEEIGVTVEVTERVWDHTTPNGSWKLCGYLATITAGQPTPNPDEVHELMWLTTDEGASHPDALPACPEIFEILGRKEKQK